MHKAADVIVDRAARYGKMSDVAFFTREVERLYEGSPSYNQMDDTAKECLHMILHKIARAVSGDPTYIDNPTDIAGYAMRWQEHLEQTNGQL